MVSNEVNIIIALGFLLGYLFLSESESESEDIKPSFEEADHKDIQTLKDSKTEPPPTKYYLFLDVDGTLTKLAGEHLEGLYSLYSTFGPSWIDIYNDKLFGTQHNLLLIKKILQILCSSNRFEIFITTNNYYDAIQDLWTKVFECPWSRVNKQSAFRGSPINKLNLVKEINKQNNKQTKILFFDDDPINFKGQTVDDNIAVIDCSKNWLGDQIMLNDMIYEHLDESVLVNAIEYLYNSNKKMGKL